LPVSPEDEANIFAGSPHKAPNHVLVNEYLPGQGIMPHKDGSAYYPVVCTVSLGSSLCLDIYGCNEDGTRESQTRARILQEPRSLLITTGDIYSNYLHGIADITDDVGLCPDTLANWPLLGASNEVLGGINKRATRLSLTYRDVLKVIKLGSKFGVLGGC
jgi:alkylated DNA repair protein alkB homolog 6